MNIFLSFFAFNQFLFLFFISFNTLKNLSTSAVELGITNISLITFARAGVEILNSFIIVTQMSACDLLLFSFLKSFYHLSFQWKSNKTSVTVRYRGYKKVNTKVHEVFLTDKFYIEICFERTKDCESSYFYFISSNSCSFIISASFISFLATLLLSPVFR